MVIIYIYIYTLHFIYIDIESRICTGPRLCRLQLSHHPDCAGGSMFGLRGLSFWNKALKQYRVLQRRDFGHGLGTCRRV